MAWQGNKSLERRLFDREVFGPSNAYEYEPYLVRKLKNTQILQGHTGTVNSISWSRDGRKVLSAGDDTKICIWDGHGLKKLVESFESVSVGRLHPFKHQRLYS